MRKQQPKQIQGRVSKKNRAKKKCKLRKKTSFLGNFIARPPNWTRLNDNLAATLYCSFNLLVLVESPFTWFSPQLGNGLFLFQGGVADAFRGQQPHKHW